MKKAMIIMLTVLVLVLGGIGFAAVKIYADFVAQIRPLLIIQPDEIIMTVDIR